MFVTVIEFTKLHTCTLLLSFLKYQNSSEMYPVKMNEEKLIEIDIK